MYPDAAKMDKQFKHAERRGIPFVVKEVVDGVYTLKDIRSGEQTEIDFETLKQKVK
jgi:histidyl-tRNA synthetase